MRLDSISHVQVIVDQGAKDSSLSEMERSALLLHFFQLVQVPLGTQLMDLRSTVTRETIMTLVHFAQTYPTEFSVQSSKYFCGTESLLKLLNNGKKLLSDMAHEGII